MLKKEIHQLEEEKQQVLSRIAKLRKRVEEIVCPAAIHSPLYGSINR